MIGQGISGGRTFGTSRDDLLRQAAEKRRAAAAKEGAGAKSIGSGIGTAVGVIGGGIAGGLAAGPAGVPAGILKGATTGGSLGASIGGAAGGAVEGEDPSGDLLQAGSVASSKRGEELLKQMMKAWG